jgi:hypothetical protein
MTTPQYRIKRMDIRIETVDELNALVAGMTHFADVMQHTAAEQAVATKLKEQLLAMKERVDYALATGQVEPK